MTGDCMARLRDLEPQSVQCVVTSPPYFGLRDYGQDGQIGLEETPTAYIDKLVSVFREVRRALRDDGTVWLNIGDSYAANGGAHIAGSYDGATGRAMSAGRKRRATDVKPKDLYMIPARVALALQADGWYLRSDIIWSKPNPMPESVTDRPTSAHEHVFLLTKSARYFYDSEAVREEAAPQSIARVQQSTFKQQTGGDKDYRNGVNPSRSMRKTLENFAANPGRNLRNVWEISSQPYPGAHFAVFPPALAERCIKAGTPERGCCPHCGQPWARTTEATFVPQQDVSAEKGRRGSGDQKPMDRSNSWEGWPRGTTHRQTTGWQPLCNCPVHDPVASVVLDPFGGAGTTGLVADRLGRHATLIELSPDYAEQARGRIAAEAGMFASVETI
jgi:DNA modification methylase